jgi:hypothetical protein
MGERRREMGVGGGLVQDLVVVGYFARKIKNRGKVVFLGGRKIEFLV